MAWCNDHYYFWRETGSTSKRGPLTRPDTIAAFWRQVDKSAPASAYRPDLGGCWLWRGPSETDGYATFKIASMGATFGMAHRIAYELVVGAIPEGFQLDHLCRVVRCVNPTHLEPVTGAENVQRGHVARAAGFPASVSR